MYPIVRRVAEAGEEHRVGLDHVGRGIPFPRADPAALDHHLRAAFVAARRFALAHVRRYVGMQTDPALDLSVIAAQRARVGVSPPLPAILAAHLHLETNAVAARERTAHTPHGLGIRAVGEQEIAHSEAPRLGDRETGHFGEDFVDPDDAALRIVDGHAVAGHLGNQRHPVAYRFRSDLPPWTTGHHAAAAQGPNNRAQQDEPQERIEIVA